MPFQIELAERLYSHVSAEALLSNEERLQVARCVFGWSNLGRDLESVSPTRWRAADSLYYARLGDSVTLSPAPGDPDLITVHYDRNIVRNTPKNRVYQRLHSLYTPTLSKLIALVLDLVPPELRRQEGQVDVHAQSTFGLVVENPHKDGSETAPVDWVVAYNVARQGRGAESIYPRISNKSRWSHRWKSGPAKHSCIGTNDTSTM